MAQSASTHHSAIVTFVVGTMLGLAGALSVTASAAADDPQLQSRHEKWTVYSQQLDGDRVCFAASAPDDAAPLNADPGEVSFIVATWASGAAREQPMLSVGYPLRLGAPSSARVGSDRFRMFTDGESAFIEDDADEPRLVRAMERGYTMRLETVSAEGISNPSPAKRSAPRPAGANSFSLSLMAWSFAPSLPSGRTPR